MEMKKGSVRTAAIVGAGIGSLFIFSPMGKDIINRIKTMFQSSNQENLLVKAGNPDPEDIGDNNMVNEGAMYSVNYYNKNMDK
ncbi:hypothetical protein [Niallia sp. NCCP-28]|uniref:hypothetical protein n=1 Tax=Niallia sp. NCCP-28 TaxID=2934712 RepID=UPI00208B5772|nr:hypothetical protein [Niallia sp. NCCP-28]GKU84434.1 hypothetical protein NCCP28_38300 [Niallia sp. NCCP-28]